MKKQLLVLALALSCFCSKAQNLTWAQHVGGTGSAQGLKMTADAQGNVYTVGIFNDIIDFDPGPASYTLASAGLSDVFILKQDASGNFTWAKSVGGSMGDRAPSIAVDALGNVYVAGEFRASVDFDPSAGSFNLTSIGNNPSMFVLKLDASGNFMWVKSPGASSAGRSMALDGAGNIYIAGVFYNLLDFDPAPATSYPMSPSSASGYMFILKLDASGNFTWARHFGNSGSENVTAMSLDAQGNVYTTGAFMSQVDFDPGPATFTLTADIPSIFISKLDAAGNFAWARTFFSDDINQSTSIAADLLGNVYTAGRFVSVVDFDPSLGTYTLYAGNSSAFITKLSAAGNFLWAKNFEMSAAGSAPVNIGSAVTCLTTDAGGNTYVTGTFNEVIDFDPGPGTYTLAAAGGTDAFISKLDNSGNLVWAKSFGGPKSNVAQAIYLDASERIYLTGSFIGTADLDPGAAADSVTASGPSDAFVLKLDNNTWAGINAFGPEINFAVYPNPAQDKVTVRGHVEDLPFYLTDLAGRLLLSGYFKGQSKTVDLGSLAAGVYLLQVGALSGKPVKIVKQ